MGSGSLSHIAEAQGSSAVSAYLLSSTRMPGLPPLFLPLTSPALAGGYPGDRAFSSVSKVWRPSLA